MKRRIARKIWKRIGRRKYLKWKTSTFRKATLIKASLKNTPYKPARITTTGPTKVYINGVFLCKVDNVRIIEKRA